MPVSSPTASVTGTRVSACASRQLGQLGQLSPASQRGQQSPTSQRTVQPFSGCRDSLTSVSAARVMFTKPGCDQLWAISSGSGGRKTWGEGADLKLRDPWSVKCIMKSALPVSYQELLLLIRDGRPPFRPTAGSAHRAWEDQGRGCADHVYLLWAVTGLEVLWRSQASKPSRSV